MNPYIVLQTVVELGSFTRAAEFLGYTQPAISQMISSLEKELSIPLLYRSRKGVRLTLEGEKLFPSIQKMVASYQSMMEITKEIQGLETGTIRIGTISSISSHWLPRLIKEFQERYPKVQFVLHQGDYTSIPEWVRTSQADFGFINPDALPHAQTTFLKSGELRAVLPLDHPLADADCISLKEIEKSPFLLLEEGHYSEPLEAFKVAGLKPSIRLCVHDDYSILSMIEAGLGVSILPELVLRKTNYQVSIVPIKPTLTRKIGLITKEKSTLPLAAKYFIDFLLQHVDELP